jgi:hypothetical protein
MGAALPRAEALGYSVLPFHGTRFRARLHLLFWKTTPVSGHANHAVTRLGDAFFPESCNNPRNGIAAHFGRLFSSYRNSYIAFRMA